MWNLLSASKQITASTPDKINPSKLENEWMADSGGFLKSKIKVSCPLCLYDNIIEGYLKMSCPKVILFQIITLIL